MTVGTKTPLIQGTTTHKPGHPDTQTGTSGHPNRDIRTPWTPDSLVQSQITGFCLENHGFCLENTDFVSKTPVNHPWTSEKWSKCVIFWVSRTTKTVKRLGILPNIRDFHNKTGILHQNLGFYEVPLDSFGTRKLSLGVEGCGESSPQRGIHCPVPKESRGLCQNR